MDIFQSNFQENLEFILKSIKEAEFIALDCEFTGLTMNEEQHPHIYDTNENRYQKIKHACQNFKICQLGMTTFQWDQNQYIAKCYNFNINGVNKQNPLSCEMNQIICMEFLAKNGFDFNKLYSDGLVITIKNNFLILFQKIIF